MSKKNLKRVMLESLEGRSLFSASGTGIEGAYYNNINFTGTEVTRVDASINKNFGTSAPAPGIGSTTYSVRWTGQYEAGATGNFDFFANTDGGVRVWVNHQQVIADWSNTTLQTIAPTRGIKLTSGKKYDIQVEYRHKTGSAKMILDYTVGGSALATLSQSRLFPGDQNLKDKIDHAVSFAQGALNQELADLGGSTKVFPSISDSTTGVYDTVAASDWTSGFFAGSLWQMYDRTESKSWRLDATEYTTPIAATDTAADDVGFHFMPSTYQLYQAMQNPADKQVLLTAAATKVATFNSKVGMFKTLSYQAPSSGNKSADFMALMDDTMDLQLVYEVGKMTGNQTYINDANSHLANVIKYMVRSDGSTYQLGYFNGESGAFVEGETKQGLSNSSTWARGQAWALYSLTTGYAETGRSDFLAAAEKVANYYISHLPADDVPYWDFNAPVTSTTPRDSSAAAIATSALLQLASLTKGTSASSTYLNAAEGALNSLTTTYLAEGSTSHGILLHAAQWVAKGKTDNSLVYGDYYFLEAINRYATLSFT